jgi:hypothetical protein
MPDPLAHLPPVQKNPALSTPRGHDEAPDLEEQLRIVRNTLRCYARLHEDDDTSRILSTFLKNLAGAGKAQFIQDLFYLRSQSGKLRLMRNHISSAILVPMAVAGDQRPDERSSSIGMDQDHDEGSRQWLKATCLRRDRGRCVLSGAVEMDVYRTLDDTEGLRHAGTECALIFPLGLGTFETGNATATRNKVLIWDAIYRYFPTIRSKIGPESLNRPQNAMTLLMELHTAFRRFSFGLEPTSSAVSPSPLYIYTFCPWT